RPWASFVWRRVEGRYVRRADVVFTVSDAIADHLAGAYGIARPVVLYNAPAPKAVAASGLLREGVAPGTVVLLHQGQMRPDRGCLRLVEAMPAVRGAVLVFLGDGPLRPVLAARAAALGVAGRVRFVDPVPPDDLLPVTAG